VRPQQDALVKVVTAGEVLVEVIAVERGEGFQLPIALRGPFPSGAPAIFIDQVAKLGQPCGIISCVGEDDFGRLNINRLARDGVDTRAVEVLAGEVTGSAFVRYREDGSRDFVFNIAHSAAALVRGTAMAAQVLASSGHLHISGSSLSLAGVADFVLGAAMELKARGGTVSFDPNVRPELAKDTQVLARLGSALSLCDVFLPSGEELLLLSGASQEAKAVEDLLARGTGCVVVKRGAEGSSYYARGVSVSVPAYPVEEVDPTGAGDCFDAAFVTCWLQGWGPEESLELANAAGARAVGVVGPMEGTSTWAELEQVRSGPKAQERAGRARAGRPRARRLDEWYRAHVPGPPPAALTSVCSAHPVVLEAAIGQAGEEGRAVLVEATCNQVNHLGGYSGLTPLAFRRQVEGLAEKLGFPFERVLLGGDHLGPNPWRGLPASQAMAEAEAMVAAYASAGYEKLHIDTSMGCQGEPPHLDDEETARRAARLVAVAEKAAQAAGNMPRYVIGTEVPMPGGLQGEAETVHVTTKEAVLATLEAHEQAFAQVGAGAAMGRVIAVVAHPGVEFDNQKVFVYRPERAKDLSSALAHMPGLVFEAHSTDYQPARSLTELVRDGFALLKVGPALTFAMREALYGLDAIACWLVPGWSEHPLKDALEEAMLANPEHWSAFYQGTPERQRLLRHFSYSDRARYYWASPHLERSVRSLCEHLGDKALPPGLVSQFLPRLYDRVASGALVATPKALVVEAVRDVLRNYAVACQPDCPSMG
jgi:D-tagatose-bisphosphate aldolase class II non-catalytic subunit